MATSMDDCFLSSHDIDMPIQHRRHAGPEPSNARIAGFDRPLSRSALFFGQGSPSPSSMMLTANQCRWNAPFSTGLPCVWDGCIRCSSGGPTGRLDTLQSPPCRMRHRGGRHDNRGKASQGGCGKG